MDISGMFPQLDVIRYMDESINNKLKNNLTLDLLTRSCIILRNKLYTNCLLKNSNGILSASDLFIPISFDSKIRKYIDKNVSKLSSDEQKVINSILGIVDNLNSSNEIVIGTSILDTVELLLSNIPDVELKETLQGFILPLLYFCNRNSYEYNSAIVVPALSYADYVCYVNFMKLKTYKFKLQREAFKIGFDEYFLSFQPAVIPVTPDDWKLLSYETLNFLRSFKVPVCNHLQQPIFNLLGIEDTEYFNIVLSSIKINETTKILAILFYNTSLANIFEQSDTEGNIDIENIVSLIKAIGSGNIRLYLDQLQNMESKLPISEASEGLLGICWNGNLLELGNISLEATGTDEEDIASPDDEENEGDETTNEEESIEEDGSLSGDENNQDQLSKFGIELESNNPSLFDILRKFTYFKQLKGLLEQPGVTSFVKMLVRHWLRYWIFIVTAESTEKFLKRIKSALKTKN